METKDRAKNEKKGKDKVIQQFTEAKSKMVAALEETRKIIRSELLKRESGIQNRFGEGTTASVLSNRGPSGKGQISVSKTDEPRRCNDRELFRWVGIAVKDSEAQENREYLIDLFYNEIDVERANPHSQIGRFQFAALLPVPLKEPGESPHQVAESGTKKGGDLTYLLSFNEHRLGDPNQSLYQCDEPKWTLDAFDPETLVEDFLQFVDEQEARNKR